MIGDVLGTAVLMAILSVPLGISVWAFLDVAKRPGWVWAFSGRRRVAWMAAIGLGMTTVVGGLAISLWYLTRVRPALASIELGDLD